MYRQSSVKQHLLLSIFQTHLAYNYSVKVRKRWIFTLTTLYYTIPTGKKGKHNLFIKDTSKQDLFDDICGILTNIIVFVW